MQRIPDEYKQLPPISSFDSLKWYVVFVGVARNILGIDTVCTDLNLSGYVIWAPTFQERCRTTTDVILVDRLLYPGYVFLGVIREEDIAFVSAELRNGSKGFILGPSPLSKSDLIQIHENTVQYSASPKVAFDVKKGDSVVVSSGFLSGFRATVIDVLDEGRVKLLVFFMHRELVVDLSVLDVQSLGENTYDFC